MATWQWRHTNDLVPSYSPSHAIIRHVHKRTNRVQGNQTTQDLEGNDGPVILMETNQNLLQWIIGRIIGMREEMSMLLCVLEIRVKCGCHPPNAEDLTDLSQTFLQHLCRSKFLQQVCGRQFLLKLCSWESLLQSCRWLFSTAH